MPSAFLPGQLVEVTGLTAPQGSPVRWKIGTPKWNDAPEDLSGQRGQLVEYSEETGHWLVATFGGKTAPFPEKSIKALKTEEVRSFDVVFGPRANPEVLGAVIADNLQQKGHVLCQMFISPEELKSMVSVAEMGVGEGLFKRLPLELEPGYLGRGGQGKTMSLEMDASDVPGWMKDSDLTAGEDALARFGNALRPYADSEFGFDMYSRTPTLLMLPFDDDENQFDARSCENDEAASFLQTMFRSKAMGILNAGPGDASLQLHPKPGSGENEDIKVTVQAGMLAVFLCDRFKFSYQPAAKALTLMTWYQDVPRSFGVSDLDGDLTNLGNVSSGPPMPQPNSDGEHVSIVALATRYAFGIDEPWKLWCAYAKAGVDTFVEFPLTRWDPYEYYDADADQGTNKSYTNHGGFSDGIEYFDCRFFDISPAEARGMDPSQRQVLEVGYIALSGAGYTKQELQRKSEQVGCFVGLDKNEWIGLPKDQLGGFGASNSANSITSNRFNYSLNLKGPSMTIDTACSASLVATHTAKLYLTNKMWDPCSACVAIGVNLLLSPGSFIACCGAGMLSHKGRCFTYNKTADGYARGESTAAHCLKLHAFDKDNGDMCMIAGSNVNQDGRSASLTAPNGPSQERCSRSVLREANISPAEVDTTECHGTGTALGDPIEIGAYRKVISSVERTEPVIVTSSKSNIGHCEGSAGISGFIKCVLMCMHAEGTPNCHLTGLNPHLDMSGFPGVLLTEGVVMRANASFNGVLSFGFGGTNACAQCWGTNTQTSRGATNSGDMYKALIKKIKAAPVEVNIKGEDWEDWEQDGPRWDSKPGDEWSLELDETGAVTYTEKEKESVDLGSSYYLTGTFNDWQYDTLEADAELAGLYAATVTVGANGAERFQVVADQDESMTFFPKTPNCRSKSAPMQGPEMESSKDFAWCLSGAKGDKFRVEFYRSESDALSISWVLVR